MKANEIVQRQERLATTADVEVGKVVVEDEQVEAHEPCILREGVSLVETEYFVLNLESDDENEI